MNRRLLVAAVVVLALAGAGALTVADDFASDPAPDAGGDATTSAGDAREETATTPATVDSATTTGDDAGYALDIRRIENCGSACRDVTAALTSEGATRRNVTATTRVYADGDLLWTGNESVGTLAAGDSHTSTKRVQVGYAGGMKIRANDGYVTIVTVVESDSGTAEFAERRKVA